MKHGCARQARRLLQVISRLSIRACIGQYFPIWSASRNDACLAVPHRRPEAPPHGHAHGSEPPTRRGIRSLVGTEASAVAGLLHASAGLPRLRRSAPQRALGRVAPQRPASLDPFTIEDSAWSAELTRRLKSWREAWSAVRAGVHRDSIAPLDEAVRPAAAAQGSTSRNRRGRRNRCYRLLLSPALTSSSWRVEIGERADRQKSRPGAAPCFTCAIPGDGAPPERTEAVPYTCTPRSTRT